MRQASFGLRRPWIWHGSDLCCLLQFFQALESGELDGEPDEWTYAALILALRRGQEYPQIIIFFAEMQEKDLAIYRDTYFAALEACERLGLWSEGGQILQTMQVCLLTTWCHSSIH